MYMENISIQLTETLKEKPSLVGLRNGVHFTDHMFLMDYSQDREWHKPRVVPYGQIPLWPSATALHYAQEIFEGLKAYRDSGGNIRLFRPLENAARFNRSAARLDIPQLPDGVFLNAIEALLKVDQNWVPDEPGCTLYVRPYIIGTDHILRNNSDDYLFVVIATPTGNYFDYRNPVKLYVESHDVRAVRGGLGTAKSGPNYAAAVRATKKASALGYKQLLWLDGVEQKYIEEGSSMNVFFKIGEKIATPQIGDSVLPGITRKSCIELLKTWGYDVEERNIPIDEVIAANKAGTLREAWGCGTSAIVAPIGELYYNESIYTINDFKIGEITDKLYKTITDIQWGKTTDTNNWSYIVVENNN
jgi:branched-chain amino acid aminotransferase